MNVVVTLEQRFDRTPDGTVWTQTLFPRSHWDRYLEVFSQVRIVARVNDVKQNGPGWKRVSGDRVSVHALPYYIGPWQFLWRYNAIRNALRGAFAPHDAVIMRAPSQIANILHPLLKREGHPYGIEVIGDPWDVFSPGALRNPIRPFLRRWFTWKLREQCRGASAAKFVTKSALQTRYPVAEGIFSFGASDIELLQEHFSSSPRTWIREPNPTKLLFVGTLEVPYKGADVLIDALAVLKRNLRSQSVVLTIVGTGRLRAELERQVSRLGLSASVIFLGHLPEGELIRQQMDNADLLILPSRTEGLPRAMIEAMARAMPCIGSDVGGVSELISREDIVPPGNVAELASKIAAVANDLTRMQAMSARNLERAQQYEAGTLRQRRIRFYEELRKRTEMYGKTA